MANIIGTQTVDGIYIISVDSDPTLGLGTPAPIGSIALTSNGIGTFTKTGALDTDWTISGGSSLTETTIDITGLTTINLTGLNNFGIINLTSSNPTETINIISNISTTQNYIFYPAAGLAVTFNDLSIGGIGANLKLAAPSLTADGTYFGYLSIQKRTALGNCFQTGFLDVYNP
jgi:hypothetical protein